MAKPEGRSPRIEVGTARRRSCPGGRGGRRDQARGRARQAPGYDAQRAAADGNAGRPPPFGRCSVCWQTGTPVPVHAPAIAAGDPAPSRNEETLEARHPPRVRGDQVTCTCGASFTTRSTAKNGVIHADVCSAVPPVLHGQAEDPRHRWPRGPVRGALRQEGRLQEVATSRRRSTARVHLTGAPGPAPFASPAHTIHTHQEPRCSRRSRNCSPSTPTWRRQLADPAVHADQARARKLGKRYAELTPIVGAYRAWKQTGDDIETAARARRRGRRTSPPRSSSWSKQREELDRAAARCCSSRATPATTRTSSSRSRRARAARSPRCSPATCCACTCGTPSGSRLEDRDHRRHRVRARRLQGRPGRGEDQGRPRRHRARAGRLGPAEVRGRGAPRAAGAGDRVPGPHPHLRRRRAGHARGRGGRGRDRPERPAHRRVPVLRARAGSASTPPTPRCASPTCRPASSSPARTRRASCRTRSRRCASCAPGCSPRPRRRPTRRGRRRPPQPGPHRRPLRADPHVQLPGEPHLRPPRRLQGVQPGPGARRRAGRRDPGLRRRRHGREAAARKRTTTA